MSKRKKKKLPKDNPSLEVIENTVKHIKEKVDEFCDQMKSVEKNLTQVSLNKQSINTLKNNVKNINDTRIPNIKKKINKKVDSTAFYVIIAVLSIVTTIVSLVSYYK